MNRVHFLFAISLVLAPTALAGDKVINLGIFLPTALGDGDERFNFGEDYANALGERLSGTVKARVYSKFEDFSKALTTGGVDVAVVDGWVTAELGDRVTALREAFVATSPRPTWVLVSNAPGSMADSKGKRLALPRGSGTADMKFASNVVFAGLVAVDESFQVVSVPTRESALKMLEVASAELALLPSTAVPSGASVVFRSEPMPLACVVVRSGKPTEMNQAALAIGKVAPFSFSGEPAGDISRLARLIERGPQAPVPEVTPNTPYRLPVRELLVKQGLPLGFPAFLGFTAVSTDLPDD